MPEQILPVGQLDTVGLILDAPPVSLPPQAFSDARNVRFRHGAIRKMEGEVNLFPSIFNHAFVNGLATNDREKLKYVAWWPNPNLADNQRGYYLVIVEDDTIGRDVATLVLPGGNAVVPKGSFSSAPSSAWQHTFFQGGFALIINNGLDAPAYILDIDGNEDIANVPNFAPLPGWESYNVRELTIEDAFTANSSRIFDLNIPVDFSKQTITVTDTTNAAHPINYSPIDTQSFVLHGDSDVTGLTTVPATDAGISNVDSEEFRVYLTSGNRYNPAENLSLALGPISETLPRQFRITVQYRADTRVTAGVVRSFGDFLVAGNLTEIDSDEAVFNPDGTINTNRIIRNLPGVVRTSDVAIPGQIPTNWNPFAGGVSTADEFVISDTGIVQDLVELQGNLYLYSNTSIATLRKTGNTSVPFVSAPVTDNYGAQTTNAVLEFDGSHFIVGSQDIYLFGGHPGSIKSVADHKVREYFFSDLNPLHENNMFILRYQQKDEIWICYPSTASVSGECDKALIWNYRNGTWTIRELRNVVSGDVGPVPGGGIPGAFIELNGTTGNNGIDALGTDEVQTLVIDSEYTVPASTQAGRTHVTNITVDNFNQSFPSFQAPGPIFHDIVIGDAFNSGSGSDQVTPLAFTFTQLQADNTFTTGFPFNVVLDSDVTAASDIRTALLANSDFNQYYELIDTIETNAFTVRARGVPGDLISSPDGSFSNYIYPDYTSGTVSIGGVILADSGTRNSLNRDSECDIRAPNNGNISISGTTRSYAFSAHVPPDCVGQLYFPDVLSGTNVDSDNITLQVDPDPPGDETRMYEEDGILSSDPMYGTGRGGEPERPNRFSGSIDSELNSQDFYQDGFPSTNAVTLPWRPVRSGVHAFVVNVPGTGGNVPTYAGENIQLTAYEVPPPAASNPDATITTRSSNPGLTGITAPTITFDTGSFRYNVSTQQFDMITDSEVSVTIYGDMTVTQSDRADEVAKYISDAFNQQAGDQWQASTREIGQSGFVHLTSALQEKKFVLINNAQPPLLREDFQIVDSEIGFKATDSDSAQRPIFTIEGPGFPAPVDYQLQHHGIQPAWLALDEMVEYIRANDNQHWDTSRLAILADSDGVRWRVLQNDENTPISSAWTITLKSVGNLGLVRQADGNATVYNPQIYNSRVERGTQLTGSFDVDGITVTIGEGDSRGAEFTRATPSLMAIRIRNTSVSTGQELILLSGDDRNTYNPPDNVTGSNNLRLTPPNLLGGTTGHIGWIETLRLANRRMNIFYEDGSSSFRLVPVNYDDLASFALEIVFNDTQDGADRIQALWDQTQAGTLNLNPYSIQQLPQETGNATLSRATFAARAPGDIPNERPTDNFASLTNTGPEPTIVFDVDRPWDTTQINPNKEYPIFASTVELDNVLTGQATNTVNMNKILGADIGWSYPIYSIDSDRNDDSEVYESYVERKQLAFTPEFSTETVGSVVILADGQYKPSIDSDPLRNRLELRMAGTSYPGEDVSLVDSDQYVRNAYNISEDYKLDVRVHGRLLNARITDAVKEANPNTSKFNSRTEWNISGLQLEFMKDGRR